MIQTIHVTKFAYLNTPKWKWYISNDQGGSFSNSGEYKSISSCMRALRQGTGRALSLNTQVLVTEIEGFDSADKPIETKWESYFAKELPNDCK